MGRLSFLRPCFLGLLTIPNKFCMSCVLIRGEKEALYGENLFYSLPISCVCMQASDDCPVLTTECEWYVMLCLGLGLG